MNNTMNHVSDQANTVKFNPTGTQWPANITDVQTALAKIGAWANADTGLPDASINVKGVIKTCSVDDVTAGTSEDRAVTPKVLKEYVLKPHATDAVYGTTKYANPAERVDTTNNVTSITPLGLDYIFTNRPANEGRAGGLRVATVAQAESGVQDDVMMTPKKTLAAINKYAPSGPGDATESRKGISKLATQAEITAGIANEGIVISPKGFAGARATGVAYGTFKQAQDADMVNLTATDMAVTPWSLGRNKGTIGKFGVVKLVAGASSDANTALASTAPVIYKNVASQVLSHALYLTDTKPTNKLATVQDAYDVLPIGSVLMWPSDSIPAKFAIMDGRWLNRTTYAALFAVIGTRYGSSGSSFQLPDMRGMFPRGSDQGRGIDSGRQVGTQQRGSVEYHKHFSGWGEHSKYPGYFGSSTKTGYRGSKSTDWDNQLDFTNDGSAFDGANPNPSANVMGNETRPINIALNFIIKIE